MGRRRKAWLAGGNGKLRQRGGILPGYYAMWNEYAANGRRTYRSKHFHAVSAARTWVKQFNARMDLGAIGQVAPVPYPKAIEEFLAGCSTLSHGTTVQYSGALGMFRVLVEDRHVHEIHGGDIDRFINWRLKESSEATVAKHIRALRRFFRWSLKRGMTDHIPLDQATALPSDRSVRPKPVLTEKDLDRLVSELDTEDRKLAVQLAMTTGLDRGVITKLAAAQVDLDEACIRVQRPKTRRRRPDTLVVPLHHGILAALASRIAQRKPTEPLLVGLTRQERSEDWWKLAVERAGLEGLRFADLRSVGGSQLHGMRPRGTISTMSAQRVGSNVA